MKYKDFDELLKATVSPEHREQARREIEEATAAGQLVYVVPLPQMRHTEGGRPLIGFEIEFIDPHFILTEVGDQQ